MARVVPKQYIALPTDIYKKEFFDIVRFDYNWGLVSVKLKSSNTLLWLDRCLNGQCVFATDYFVAVVLCGRVFPEAGRQVKVRRTKVKSKECETRRLSDPDEHNGWFLQLERSLWTR